MPVLCAPRARGERRSPGHGRRSGARDVAAQSIDSPRRWRSTCQVIRAYEERSDWQQMPSAARSTDAPVSAAVPPILELQRMIGNQAVRSLLERAALPANAAGETYQRKAALTWENGMRVEPPGRDSEFVQAKSARPRDRGHGVAPLVAEEVRHSPGEALAGDIGAFSGPRSRYGFISYPARPQDPFDPFQTVLKEAERESRRNPPASAQVPEATVPGDTAQQYEIFRVSGWKLLERPDVVGKLNALADKVEAHMKGKSTGAKRSDWQDSFHDSIEYILTIRPTR